MYRGIRLDHMNFLSVNKSHTYNLITVVPQINVTHNHVFRSIPLLTAKTFSKIQQTMTWCVPYYSICHVRTQDLSPKPVVDVVIWSHNGPLCMGPSDPTLGGLTSWESIDLSMTLFLFYYHFRKLSVVHSTWIGRKETKRIRVYHTNFFSSGF